MDLNLAYGLSVLRKVSDGGKGGRPSGYQECGVGGVVNLAANVSSQQPNAI